MSDVTKKKKNNDEQNEEKDEYTDVDAFKDDLHLAEYMERVEKGLLTPEEQACREAIRKFIGLK